MNEVIAVILMAGTVQLQAALPRDVSAACKAEGGCVLLSLESVRAMVAEVEKETKAESCRKDSV